MCVCVCVCVCTCACLVPQLCSILCNPVNCGLPGSSVREIFPGKNTGTVAISYSKGSSQPRDCTCVSHVFCMGRQIILPLASDAFSFLSGSIHIVGSHPFRKQIRRNV